MSKHITLTVDYHDRACVIRWFDHGAGRDQVFSEVPTTKEALNTMVEKARLATGRQGSVTWLQESTTGWARVQALVADRAQFLLANVLQMPLPPKGRRRKTRNKVDTARLAARVPQRQLAAGLSTPCGVASTPPARSSTARGWSSDVTALRNWINRYLAHRDVARRAGPLVANGTETAAGLAEALAPHRRPGHRPEARPTGAPGRTVGSGSDRVSVGLW